MIVMKFGGTSVGNAECIKHVVDLISGNDPKIVVVSAMAGTTNQLVAIDNLLWSGEIVKAAHLLNEIEKKYLETADELLKRDTLKEQYSRFLNDVLFKIHMGFQENHTEQRSKELIVTGELITAELIFLYLKQREISCDLWQSADIIRLTPEGFPDMPFITQKMNGLLFGKSENTLFLTQGFICRDSKGNIDNLKRGGSDYSATILGAAAGASEIQIWSDIDGLHNNDPRFVYLTQTVKSLSFEEAGELAYFGAKVLHPTCIIPAKRHNIPIRLKNTFDPSAEGTLINGQVRTNGVKAVAAKDGIIAITVHSDRMFQAYGFLKKVFDIFEQYRTSVDMITTSEISVALTIDDKSQLGPIVQSLGALGEIEVRKEQTIICVVGDFSVNPEKSARQVLEAFDGIPVIMISFGASRRNISLLINSANKIQVLNSLNNHLFNTIPCLILN
ncbi:MAG: aspartate kinase [Bacteroidales bacterium]|jgi:aspartate kinase|nr:aspartate kinase [Bacteroidales bacterium]